MSIAILIKFHISSVYHELVNTARVFARRPLPGTGFSGTNGQPLRRETDISNARDRFCRGRRPCEGMQSAAKIPCCWRQRGRFSRAGLRMHRAQGLRQHPIWSVMLRRFPVLPYDSPTRHQPSSRPVKWAIEQSQKADGQVVKDRGWTPGDHSDSRHAGMTSSIRIEVCPRPHNYGSKKLRAGRGTERLLHCKRTIKKIRFNAPALKY